MSNILNNNRVPFTTCINRRDFWDFCLSSDSATIIKQVKDVNIVANIDLNIGDCVWFDKLYSNKEWVKAVNNGLVLNNIGYTGIDNGLISYDKTMMSNHQFLNIFLNSNFEIPSTNKFLQLNKVSGNNQIFDYSCNITYLDNTQAIECNGGFYQGFWKTKQCEYKVLPDIEDEDLCFEFDLKPSDLFNSNFTLNNLHPENKGIFFYLGTRSENKWGRYYKTEEFEKSHNGYFNDDYINQDYKIDKINDNYTRDYTYEEMILNYLDDNGYINKEYINYQEEEFKDKCLYECNNYFADDYIVKDVEIDEKEIVNEGEKPLSVPDRTIEIKTDNKFLFFNKTCDGFTTRNWDENTEVIIEDYKRPNIGNYFTLFNKTKNGYTTKTINTLIQDKMQEYKVLDDLYKNAIGFQIKEDGSIGYKYMVKDCENNTYKILSEFSKTNIVKNEEWSKIHITIQKISNTTIEKTMILKIFVNGKLKLVSKEIPLLNIRELNEPYYKQEGVPFSISIGGGTQGLCDVIYPRYTRTPEYCLPLEKEFGGSFIGYIKSFKIYTCENNIQEIVNLS